MNQTDCHLVLCNSNLAQKGRMDLLNYFQNKGFITILVHFDIPDNVLYLRITESQRSKDIFTSASSFQDVLARQQKSGASAPKLSEADHLFIVSRNEEDVPLVIKKIIEITERM